jgi:two-component system NtrC family sensor kinase
MAVVSAPSVRESPPGSAVGVDSSTSVSAIEAERLAQIIEIQQAIATTSLDMDQVIESVLQGAQALTRAEGVGLVMRGGPDGIDFPLRGATSTGPARAAARVSADEPSLMGECLRTGRVLRCDDTETDPRVHRETSRASGTRSILYMPVRDRDNVIGVVGAVASRPHAFSERDEQSLTLLSGLLSAAIARAVAFETNEALLAERTQTLAALARSEERYRSVAEQICEVLFETDRDGTLLFLSAAWQTVTGYDVEETIGTSFVDALFSEDRAPTLAALQAVVRGERTQFNGALRYRTRDGGMRWLGLRARPRADASGHIIGIAGTLNDITDRVAAEQALRRQALTFDTIHDAVVVIGPDGRVLDWNPAAERIFGYDRASVVGRRPAFLVADRTAAREMTVALARAERWSGELRGRHRDQSDRLCESELVPLLDASGTLVCTIAVSRDVTSRKQLEQQLLQAQKLEAIGQLVAGIAHEINTPTQYVGDNMRFIDQACTDVLGVMSSLRRVVDACREQGLYVTEVAAADAAAVRADVEFLVEELPGAIHHALEGTERIAEIVRGMKAFSHSGSGALTPADLNQQLEAAITVSRHEWSLTADVVREFDTCLPLVRCRVEEMNQVFLNIIVNAAQAIDTHPDRERRKGEIRVSTRLDGAWAEVRVTDTGTGIPVDARPRIFDPFFTTKPVGKGTGQGLAVAHGIVEKHGGGITFETELGVGTTFIVRLPISGLTSGLALPGAA